MPNPTIADQLRQMQPQAPVFPAGSFSPRGSSPMHPSTMARRARAAQAAGEALQRVLPRLGAAASRSPAYSFGVVAHLTADDVRDPAAQHMAASLSAPAAALEVLFILRGRVLDREGGARGYLSFEDSRRIEGAGWQLHLSDPYCYGWFATLEPADSWIHDILVAAKWR